MNIVKNEAQVPRWWETIGGQSLPTFIISVLAFPVAALLGVAIGALDPVYGAAAAGCMVMVLIVLLRWDALAITAIIAVHLYIDWYLGLHLVALLMALILLFAYYFVRSTDHPWIGPRLIWLWILFLVLTIYPAINGGSLRPYDAATFYPGLVLGAFMMFWLGNIIAKDISALRRVFQFLTVLAVLLAIHTIIQATTGVFLFVTARGEAYLDTLSNFQILGTNASRSGSFFGSPNGNAAFLATTFFLSFGLFIESKQLWTKLLYFLEMLLILLALMLTYSNGAWIAVFGGILAFVILVGHTRYRMLLLVLIAVLVVVALTIFPVQIAVQLSRASGPNELSLHVGSWQTAIRVIEAFPLSGVGLGGQAYLVRANPYRVPAQIVPLEEPDNSYLQWGAMAGIPVMIVFLLLLGCVFWFSWRNWRVIDPRYRPLLGGGIATLIALSINSMSVDGWTSPTGLATLAWLIAGIVTSPFIGHCLRQQPTPPVDSTAETIPTQVEASRMDKAKRVSDMPDMSEYSIEPTGKPAPAVEKTRRYCDTLATSAHATEIDDVVTSELPVVEIVQLPTQIGERATPVSSPSSFPTVDSASLTDQPTWKLPVIPGPRMANNRVSPLASQTTGGESYLGLIYNLVKNSGIYAFSSLASPLVSLLLLPFLTRELSHADYGALAVLDTAVALVSSITLLGLDAAFTRVYLRDCKTHRERLNAISTLTLLLLLIIIPFTLIGIMAAPWLSVVVLGSASYSGAIDLAVLVVLLQNLTKPGLAWMRVEDRATRYSIISIANFLLVAGATIVLVGMLHMGVMGALIAIGLGNVIVAICTLPLIFLRAGFRLCSAMAVSMLTFGVPYAMNFITMWVLQLSDRYLLGHFASLSVAANYTIAYSLGSGVSFVITIPFSMAWWVVIYSIARRDDAMHVFKLIFRWYSFVLLFATLGLALFAVSVLNLLFPVSYHGQSLIISVVALSTVFSSIFVVFNLGMTLLRKTWLAFIAVLFSALLNVGMNIVLIPLYGAMGAAIATLVAYIALALVSYLFNQRIYPVPFEMGLFLLALGIGIVLYFADNRLAQGQSDVIIWGIHIGLLLLYGGTLVVLGLLPSRKKIERTMEEDVTK